MRRVASGALILSIALLTILPAAAYANAWAPKSPGYWKSHPAAWPVETIVVGGVTYTKAQAIALLGADGGDKSITMFRHTLAGKLNMLAAGVYPIQWLTDLAEQWLAQHPAGSGVGASSDAWRLEGIFIYDSYPVFCGYDA